MCALELVWCSSFWLVPVTRLSFILFCCSIHISGPSQWWWWYCVFAVHTMSLRLNYSSSVWLRWGSLAGKKAPNENTQKSKSAVADANTQLCCVSLAKVSQQHHHQHTIIVVIRFLPSLVNIILCVRRNLNELERFIFQTSENTQPHTWEWATL